MSEVERYWIDPNRLVQEGWHQDDTCVVKDWAYDRVVAERDALQALLTAADERADSAIAFVTRLIQCSEGQPSIASGYLRDILDALKQTEGVLTPTTCTWQYGAFSWHTSCGQEWMLNDGTPEQNGMRFCHSCGKTLVVEGEGDDA